MLLEILKET